LIGPCDATARLDRAVDPIGREFGRRVGAGTAAGPWKVYHAANRPIGDAGPEPTDCAAPVSNRGT